MSATRLTHGPWWARERPDHDIVLAGAAFTAAANAVVIAVALLVWALAPASWQSLIADKQHTDATALTVVSLWANNLIICCLPVLAGVFAHRLIASDRSRWARIVIAIAAVAAVRSLVIIGLVGGLDPGWLARAAPWWILETTALAACCAAGWLAFRNTDSDLASHRLAYALTFACASLGIAAVIEVALT